MRTVYAALLLAALTIGGTYWYQTAYSVCRVPIAYDIGILDDRFNLTRDEARAAVSGAESLWEDATGLNLFTFEEGASFTINFLYDDRQEVADQEQVLREVLDQKENMSESIRQEYENLIQKYGEVKATYEARIAAHENDLAKHNGEVAYWNNEGGAPPEVYDRLNATQAELGREREELDRLVGELNQLVDGINQLGEEGNRSVQDYNQNVEVYNARFHEEREFTQGDYQGDFINIYQFDDTAELRQVLAHELGHALSLGHVEDPGSIMYFLMEGQLADPRLSSADLEEFTRVCGR